MLSGKKIAFINSGNYGSTGKIIYEISKVVEKEGGSTIRCYPEEDLNLKSKDNDYIISSNMYLKINRKIAIYTGLTGRYNLYATSKLIKFLRQYKPDIIHLHNLHNSYINLTLLFNYIREDGVKVVWTLHDCWSYTGHCAHYTMANCYKWINGCIQCNYYSDYPYGLFDNARKNYIYKKNIFCGIKKMFITTPSNWLYNQVKKSFLGKYNIRTISNAVDTGFFKPTYGHALDRYNIDGKKIILGVSFDWTIKKGIDVFCELSKRISNEYVIILIGKCDCVDLPTDIIHIDRTDDKKELAELYTAAFVLVNPTREEVFGLVNVESLACGTPVITFNTGGSSEIINETCGLVCEENDYKSIIACINKLNMEYPKQNECIKRAMEFDYRNVYQKYVKLYKEIIDMDN